MSLQICLGTAQFGLDYGITNNAGRVSNSNVLNLLAFAHQANVKYLDTAQAYGDAEAVVGSNLPLNHTFDLISKLRPQQCKYYTCDSIASWEESFQATCRKLKCSYLNSFLLHSPYDLRKDGSQFLINWLLSLKERGLVQRIGISIYDSTDLDNIPLGLLDLVQLPLSLYDQRLLNDGTIDRLRSNNVAIHARSIYLQGLLLTSVSNWPSWVDTHVLNHHSSLELRAIHAKCELIDLAIGFAREQESIEAIVLGICDIQQFKVLIDAFTRLSPWSGDEWKSWSLDDKKLLDPRLWPT